MEPPSFRRCIARIRSLKSAQRWSYSACFWSTSCCFRSISSCLLTISSSKEPICSDRLLIWLKISAFCCSSCVLSASASALLLCASLSCWLTFSCSVCSSCSLWRRSLTLEEAASGVMTVESVMLMATAALSRSEISFLPCFTCFMVLYVPFIPCYTFRCLRMLVAVPRPQSTKPSSTKPPTM